MAYPRQENRRHKRLMARAAKLELADLIEIAGARGWRSELPGQGTPSAAASAACASGEGVPAVAAADAHSRSEPPLEDERRDASPEDERERSASRGG